MLHVSDRDIANFMDICHKKNSRHVCCTVTEDMVNEILRNNAIKTVNTFEITTCFVEFLFLFKAAVCLILGGSSYV